MKHAFALFSILLVALLCFTGTAAADDEYTFKYLLDNTLALLDCVKHNENVRIPSTYEGKNVTEVHRILYKDSKVKSIVFPDSLKTIKWCAAQECPNLVSIYIGAETEFIGNDYSVTVLSRTKPETTDETHLFPQAGANPFANCPNLSNIEVSEANIWYDVLNGCLYDLKARRLVCYPAGYPGEAISIPDGIQMIAGQAFAGAKGLKSITIPSSVKVIGDDAFANCNPELKLVVYEGSAAESYAVSMEIPHRVIPNALIELIDSKQENNETDKLFSEQVHKGDTLAFGHWEQDNDLANGPEAIEWQVLEVDGDRALLISKYGLEPRVYHDDPVAITWAESSLRAWLNGEFAQQAFERNESAAIKRSLVKTEDNGISSGGKDTSDRLFLLSLSEAQQYLQGNAERKTQYTPWALAKALEIQPKLKTDGSCAYWLRSPGQVESENVVYVHMDGSLTAKQQMGYAASKGVWMAVRPAMWVDLNASVTIPDVSNAREGLFTEGICGTFQPETVSLANSDTAEWKSGEEIRQMLTCVLLLDFENGVSDFDVDIEPGCYTIVSPDQCIYIVATGEKMCTLIEYDIVNQSARYCMNDISSEHHAEVYVDLFSRYDCDVFFISGDEISGMFRSIFSLIQ